MHLPSQQHCKHVCVCVFVGAAIPLDVSLEQAVYDVMEGDAFVEVCAVLEPLAPPASLAGSTRTIDLILELSPRSATFGEILSTI